MILVLFIYLFLLIFININLINSLNSLNLFMGEAHLYFSNSEKILKKTDFEAKKVPI